MRWRPRLRTLLLLVNLAILVLPVGGVTILRLYESALVRQTESELLGQAAVLAAAYKQALLRVLQAAARAGEYGLPIAAQWLPPDTGWQPRTASLDLAVDVVRPRAPEAPQSSASADPVATKAGARSW